MTDAPDYFEQGLALFKREPELLSIEVWRRADAEIERREDYYNFVSGYMTGRRQRDEFEREQI